MSDRNPRKTTQKVLLSVTALAAAAALAGAGTYASFTGSVSASQSVTSGTMSLTLPAAGSTNRLATPATGFAPADSMQRAVDLTVSGDVDMSAITLTTADATAPVTILSTDTINGLQITVERCAVAWTESPTVPAGGFTYMCAAPLSVIARTPVVGSARAMNNVLVAAGSVNRLRITIDLPVAAGDTFQNTVASPKTAAISHVFNGVQRAGIAK